MNERLYLAAYNGDTEHLQNLLHEDPLLLSRPTIAPDSPLHISAVLGHTDFARLVISTLHKQNLQLLYQKNQHGYPPIHLASSLGHLDIVSELINIDNNMCLMKDSEGRTPLHCAASNGRLDVVKHLITVCPQSAQEVTSNNETILHLAVNYSQTEVMGLVIPLLQEQHSLDEVIDLVDGDGNTALQLATASKKGQMRKMLMRVKDNEAQSADGRNENQERKITVNDGDPSHSVDVKINNGTRDGKLESVKNGVITLCSLFATFCFEAVLNPPGGVWQERPSTAAINYTTPHHLTPFSALGYISESPEKVLAPNKAMSLALEPSNFLYFLSLDCVCFISSLFTIMLIMTAPFSTKFVPHITTVMLLVVMFSAFGVYLSVMNLITSLEVIFLALNVSFIMMLFGFAVFLPLVMLAAKFMKKPSKNT